MYSFGPHYLSFLIHKALEPVPCYSGVFRYYKNDWSKCESASVITDTYINAYIITLLVTVQIVDFEQII